jgi:hypothetical protein
MSLSKEEIDVDNKVIGQMSAGGRQRAGAKMRKSMAEAVCNDRVTGLGATIVTHNYDVSLRRSQICRTLPRFDKVHEPSGSNTFTLVTKSSTNNHTNPFSIHHLHFGHALL